DVALDGVLEPIGIDDLTAVVGDGELARPDLSARAVDIDLGDDRAAGAVALGIGDAAGGDLVAGLVLARRGPRLPARLFGGGLDPRDVARVLDVTQAELDGIKVERRHLVHEHSLAKWICGPTGSRRCALRSGELRSSSGAMVSHAMRLLANSYDSAGTPSVGG